MHTTDIAMRRASWRIAVVRRGRSPYTSKKQKAMGHLTEAQYKIIADRMIEEHRKYGDRLRPGHWADLAAAKIVSSMRDVAQPPAREVVGMTTDEAMIVIDNATDEDLKRNDPDLWQDLRKEFDFFLSVKRDAALASQPKDPAPTVDQMVDVFHGWQTANHNGWSQDAINADLRARLTKLLNP